MIAALTNIDFLRFFILQQETTTMGKDDDDEHMLHPEKIDDNNIIQKNDIQATNDTLKCSGIILNVIH